MITPRRLSIGAGVIGVVAVAGLVGGALSRPDRASVQVALGASPTHQPTPSVSASVQPLDCPSGFSFGTVYEHVYSAVPAPNPLSGEVADATELITEAQRDQGEPTSLSVREVSRQDRRAVYRFATSERDVAEAHFDRIGPDQWILSGTGQCSVAPPPDAPPPDAPPPDVSPS